MIVTDTEIQINGMAHVILCVSDLGTARKFYERLLPALGMTTVCAEPEQEPGVPDARRRKQ